jgi:hypothetical protein
VSEITTTTRIAASRMPMGEKKPGRLCFVMGSASP